MQRIIPYSDNYKFTPWDYEMKIAADIDILNFTTNTIIDGVEEYTEKEKILISPNPAGDYIEISRSIGACPNDNEASLIASEFIQIFDMLGIDVSPAGGNGTSIV